MGGGSILAVEIGGHPGPVPVIAKEKEPAMKPSCVATLLTLAALSAAPLLHAATWTPTGWDGTLDLSGGFATVSVLIRTDANFREEKSPIFEVNDGLHTDSGNTAFRMADADDANTNGNDIGIVRGNDVTKWANGSKTFPTKPNTTYLLSLVYVYDGERLTVTAYVNGTLIYTGFSTRSEQEDLTAQRFQTWPGISFYSIVSANGYDQALTAGQLAAMAGKETSDLDAVPSLDVLQADLAALPATGGTVTLAGDVDASGVGAPIVLDKPVTLVGGGHTLTAPAEGPLFQVKADLTLDGVTIANTANTNPVGHAIVVGGDAAAHAEGAAGQTLTVTGETTIPGGIGVYEGQTLTITGAGTLTVTGAPGCAAIGGSAVTPACGDIVIDMTGTLNATGGIEAAGIGGGVDNTVTDKTATVAWAKTAGKGSVTVKSGTVTAIPGETSETSGDPAAAVPNTPAGCGAGIGGGYNTALESIVIEGGTVVAGNEDWVESQSNRNMPRGGAGIGAAYCGSTYDKCFNTTVTITGGEVTAYGAGYAAGIGGTRHGSPASITITGGEVYAVGQGGAAAIGGGPYGATVATVTIGGTAKVIAEAMLHRVLGEDLTEATSATIGASAAIGGGYAGVAGDIHITGNAQVLAVNAGKGSYTWGTNEPYISRVNYDMVDLSKLEGGAAIGTGRIPSHGPKDENGQLIRGSITIDGQAQVWAYGGAGGAGIGGGHDSWIQTSKPDVQLGTAQNYPPITIGGTAQVYAQGGVGASAIGGGQDAQHGSAIAIASTASVEAKAGLTKGEEGYTTPAAIGTGSYNVNDDHSVSGVVSDTQVAEATLTVTDVTLPAEGNLTLNIVTLGADGTPEHLTDSPGLIVNLDVAGKTYMVAETTGSEAGNLISGLILDPEARIGSTPYATLEAAFAAAKENDTITLLKDITRDAIAETITVDFPVTLKAETLTTVTLPGGVETPYLTLNADLSLSNIHMKSTKQPIVHPIVVGKRKTVTLTAKEQNQIDGGIGVYDGTALTLAGDGLLVAWGFGPANTYGDAGIGGSKAHPACGDIVIAMEGGTLQAITEADAAAIGSGIASAVQEPKGSVTIQSGTVTARSWLRGYYGACIGGGWNVPVKSIAITGGTVTAGVEDWVVDAGTDGKIAGPVGIGVSYCGTTSGRLVDTSISITGGKVTAYGSAYMAAIGGGFRVSVKSIEIAGTAAVTAVTAGGAAAIGGGPYGVGGQAITIGGDAKVIAEALLYREVDETIGGATTTTIGPGAAIGGGYAGKSGTIVIEGNAQVLATNAGVGSYDYWGDGQYASVGKWTGDMTGITGGAAIGAGRIPSYPKDDMSSIIIQGNARVWAYGGRCNAGIGGGDGGWINPAEPDKILGASPNFPPISILGNAAVVAKGGLAASGIGGGVNAQVGSLITIAHTAAVKAQAGATALGYTTPAAIGLGSYNANYQYSPDQRPSTLAPATQPTTTLRVTGVTAGEGGTLALNIVTLDSAGNAENLTDSPGLALQVKIGETLYAVSKTEGTADYNKVLEGALVANPVSGDILSVAGSGSLLLPVEDTFYLADADGNVVARVDKVDGTTTGTITKLDDALTLAPLSIYTKTGNLEEVKAADAAAILGVEDHATWVVTQAEDTLSSELAHVYDFGIAGLTIDKEQGTLTAVTVKMTEGVDCAPRNVTLANATLTVYANGTAIATVPAPVFGEDGTLTVKLDEAYTPGATSTLSVSLTLKEASAP